MTTSESPAGSRGRVLVVDDEHGPRESLRFLLNRTYDVECVNSVDAGIEAIKRQRPDLVIMDIRMPGRNGIEGLEAMRGIAPDVSIVMLTGYGSLETAQDAIRHGAADYLKKPFDAREMLEVVQRNVDRTRLNRRRSQAETRIEELTKRLQEEVDSRDRLSTLGMASSELVHDLRNPLSVVLGYVGLLAEDLQNIDGGDARGADVRDYLSTIEQNVRICTELTEMWHSLGCGGGRFHEPMELWPLLEALMNETRRGAPGAACVLEGDAAARTACVPGTALQLRRAFQNLVNNAVEALPEQGGRVTVSYAVDADHVTVRVADNGSGIEPERLKDIFEPFHGTTKGRRGTGLGMFIVHKVVEDHQGRIDIRSEVGRGTQVTVTLPRCREAPEKAGG